MSRDYKALRRDDELDATAMAWAIQNALHYCIKIPPCKDATRCVVCSNAARLAVQHYRPIIEKRVVDRLVNYYGAGCTGPHPGDD